MTVDVAPQSTTVRVERVTGRIGAEIRDVNLANATDDEVGAIRRALLDHRVVFVRDQDLDAAGQIAFAARLGPLTHGHPTLPARTEHTEILDLDALAGGTASYWHTDVTFVEHPPWFSILRAVVLPPVGGDTLWANTVAAYHDLPADLRALADGLHAVHTNANDYASVDLEALAATLTPEQVQHIKNFVSTVYETDHPVVRLHPETGERALLLGGFAQRLRGHSSYESVDLLRTLQAYVIKPENTVRWRWRPGDVVIWDNRATQHYAVADFGSERRRMQRVTTGGEAVIGYDGTASVSLKGDASQYYAVV